jgi:hypothetical protein
MKRALIFEDYDAKRQKRKNDLYVPPSNKEETFSNSFILLKTRKNTDMFAVKSLFDEYNKKLPLSKPVIVNKLPVKTEQMTITSFFKKVKKVSENGKKADN